MERIRNIISDLEAPYRRTKRHDLGQYVHWKGNSSAPIHRWLRYREAYSPELIDHLNLEGRILDPFSGCGSIMVGAAQRKKRSVGIDINPLSTFSTEVKLKRLDPQSVAHVREFRNRVSRIAKTGKEAKLPSLSIAQKVFEPQILRTLMRLKHAINMLIEKDQAAGDFAKLAWIECLEKVGSYFKEGNGIKYRSKKRQKGKYENHPDGEWQLRRFGTDQVAFVVSAMESQLDTMLADTREWRSGHWGSQQTINGSAMRLDQLLNGKQFDSIIFSPPYANRFDYFESFKVEMWFGDFVSTYDELNTLRKESLRSHLAARLRSDNPPLGELEGLIEHMDQSASSWRMGVADLLRGYFQDLQTVLEKCRKISPNGTTYVVVGNSAFAGVIIPTDLLTAKVAQRCGFDEVELLECRHLTVSPQQRVKLNGLKPYMRESIVVLR